MRSKGSVQVADLDKALERFLFNNGKEPGWHRLPFWLTLLKVPENCPRNPYG